MGTLLLIFVPLTQLPRRHERVEKLLCVIVCPPFRGFSQRFRSVLGWFLGILALSWTTDRFDGDFFNRLTSSRQFDE
jgi:hypothetical protein